jgi:hypothetical protein
MEFKRFLDTVIRIPAMVIVRVRALVVRLVAPVRELGVRGDT